MTTKTHFADPERSTADDISKDNKLLHSETSFLDVLGAISGITAILDENRQIVYANESFVKLTGIASIEVILGKRPGEAVGCVHAGDMAAGCGTSEACAYCGAVSSILESQLTGKKAEKETRIVSEADGRVINWDLKITTSPVKLRAKTFYVFSVEDISSEKRRQNLERIFFHDILNSAGNLNGLLTLLKEGSDPQEEKELIDLSEESSRELIDEILAHRQLKAAENGDLVVNPERILPAEFLKAAVARISGNEISKNKTIIIADNAGDTSVITDKMLLQRILNNMLINALEATEEKGVVTAGVELMHEKVRFSIKNDHVMPDSVRLQIFQRSFTTKGTGRGTGTYSIKLLTESYLKGLAGFASSEKEGTIFWIDLPLNGKR
ncbi:MAG: ATP-binding protein [Bacteroidales bacterium]|jgi:K+-sensing histidine kinase KdpD